MRPPVRRIVTAIDPEGRSHFAEDGPSPGEMTMGPYRNTNLWRTVGGPTDIAARDSIAEQSGVLPPAGGTVVRIIDIPPENPDPEIQRRGAEAVFKTMFPDAAHDPNSTRHSGMHTTDTIDYAIVIEGELTAIMDEGETVMRPGDVLIQRGTSHSWANRSDDYVRIAFILVDGKR